MNDYQKIIYKTNYARWNGERRENWEESVIRYKEFFTNKFKEDSDFTQAINHILSMDVMPSMRAFWSAGEALEESNIAAYNCAYLTFETVKDFAEHLYILMHGTGNGYSVERQIICNLPTIPDELIQSDKVLIVEDSKLGWAQATQEYFTKLYEGEIITIDYSKIRPKGAILKTFGGRSSGYKPLEELYTFAAELFKKATGRKLNSVENNDLACYIANIVVSGGK